MCICVCKAESFEILFEKHLDLKILDILKTSNGFLLFDGYKHEEKPTRIQKIDYKGRVLFEKTAHSHPELLSVTYSNNNYFVRLKDINHSPNKVAVFNSMLQLEKISILKCDEHKLQFEEGLSFYFAQQLDDSALFFSAGVSMTGLYIYKLNSSTNFYEIFYRVSSPYSKEEDKIWRNNDALIPDLYDAKVMCYFDGKILLKGKVKHEIKYFVLCLNEKSFYEVMLNDFENVVCFQNSNLLLCSAKENIYMYCLETQKTLPLNYTNGNSEIIKLIATNENTGEFLNNNLFWISKINHRYLLNVFSTKDANIHSTYICPDWRDVKMICDKSSGCLFVINEANIFEDINRKNIVDCFSDFDNRNYKKTTLNFDDNIVAICNGKVFLGLGLKTMSFGEKERFSKPWKVCDINSPEVVETLVYPFDKNVLGSNFNGVALSEQQKNILLQYGAKSFDEN